MSLIFSCITKNDIVASLVSNNKLKDAAAKNLKKNSNHHLVDDLMQELYLFLLNHDEIVLRSIYTGNSLYWYCVGFFHLQTRSIRSPFMWENFKQRNREVDIDGDYNHKNNHLPHDQKLNKNHQTYFLDYNDDPNELNIRQQLLPLSGEAITIMNEYLNSIHWYDKRIFDFYMEENATVRSVSKMLDIKMVSIQNTQKKVKDGIRAAVKKKFNEKDKNGLTTYDKLKDRKEEE